MLISGWKGKIHCNWSEREKNTIEEKGMSGFSMEEKENRAMKLEKAEIYKFVKF